MIPFVLVPIAATLLIIVFLARAGRREKTFVSRTGKMFKV